MSDPEDDCPAVDETDNSLQGNYCVHSPDNDDERPQGNYYVHSPDNDDDGPKGKQSVAVRSRINQRERRRMQDLNVAMDALREVMPYANGPSVRKLSKIATLSLARNYIQMLTKSVEELKLLLDEAYRSRGVPSPAQFQRVTPPVHPGVWSFTSRDFRGHSYLAGCAPPPSPVQTPPCVGGCDSSYACCPAVSGPAGLQVALGGRASLPRGPSASLHITHRQ